MRGDAAGHHHELVAAEAAHRLARSADGLEPPRDRDQQLVPQRVAVRVVHGLEVVEVAEEHGGAAVAPSDAPQLALQQLEQVAPVGQGR